MKTWQTILLAAALVGTPLLASAAGTPPPAAAPSPTPAAKDAKSQADLEKQLEDARQKLSEDARRVADLSMQLNGAAMDNMVIVRDRMEKLQKRGFLGVDLDDDRDDGVALSGVSPGGPADKAGLRVGDVITAINGTAFKASGDDSASDKLVEFMHNAKPGDSLKVTYSRDGKSSTATVTAGAFKDFTYSMAIPPMPPTPPMPPMPALAPPAAMPSMPGFNYFFSTGRPWGEMQLVSMSAGLGQYFGTDKGLLVLHVPKDSALQLQEGDVILQVGGRDPGSPPHAMRILGSYGPGESVKLDIMRKGKPVTLNVTLPKSKEDPESNAYTPAPDMDDDDESEDGR